MNPQTPQSTPETITLGRGTTAQRVFVITAGGTLAQDVWITSAVRRAGLDRQTLPKDATKDSLETFLTQLVTEVFKAGVVSELLAGVLVEPSRRASLNGAEAWQSYFGEVRDYVAGIEDPKEKSDLLMIVSRIIAGFLDRARTS
jgi:hypothetical protein